MHKDIHTFPYQHFSYGAPTTRGSFALLAKSQKYIHSTCIKTQGHRRRHAATLNNLPDNLDVGNVVGGEAEKGEFEMKVETESCEVKKKKKRVNGAVNGTLGPSYYHSLPPSWRANIPVLAINGVPVSGGVDHGEAKLDTPLLNLHR